MNIHYYRLLAAAVIVDATLTIVAVILHKLYLHEHPEERKESKKGVSVWLIVVGAYLAINFLFFVITMVISAF